MFGAALQGLFGLAFGLGIIVFGIYLGIDVAAEQPWPLAILAVLLFTMPIALFGGLVAYYALRIPLALWRDRRAPLPLIDGTPIVIARKRPRRLWRTLGHGTAILVMSLILAMKLSETQLPPLAYLPFGLMLLGILIALIRVWVPPRLYWEPIVLDREGIDDRCLGRAKVGWRDVLKISSGAVGARDGTLLKLTQPPARLSGVSLIDTGFLPLVDRLFQGRRYLVVRTHGLELHNERTFRLIQAYWR
jgi:hypothetical protein